MTESNSPKTLDYGNTSGPGAGAMVWTGRILSGLIVAFMLMGAIFSFVKPEMAEEGAKKYGYAITTMHVIGYIELACLLLYAIPPTAVLGAILLTGYMGGAIATHVRVGEPQWAIPLIMGMLLWLGLFLRDARLRALIPFRSCAHKSQMTVTTRPI